jgi:nucleoside-diphosphate-sugar epimerase
MARNVALVAGATGMVGKRLATTLCEAGWRVIGLSRRPPAAGVPYEAIAVDLTDGAACRAALSGRADVTHIFYAGRYDHTTTAPEPIDTNVAMLRNLLDAVEPIAANLAHVHLVHGTKVYGSTLGPYKTPAKESDSRVLANNFYYEQEDLVAQWQRGKRWTWTTSRPQAVCDEDGAIVRNLPRLIAVYAAISRELGMPLHFPGKALAYTCLYQATDARQLARAIAWMSVTPGCANQAFNVTNGDFFRWMHVWPAFAEHFAMQAGPPRTVRLADVMADKTAVWSRIVERHRLAPTPYSQAAIWSYGDFVFGNDYDVMSDTTKLRLAGFGEFVDSERMFVRMFESLREQRIVP